MESNFAHLQVYATKVLVACGKYYAEHELHNDDIAQLFDALADCLEHVSDEEFMHMSEYSQNSLNKYATNENIPECFEKIVENGKDWNSTAECIPGESMYPYFCDAENNKIIVETCKGMETQLALEYEGGTVGIIKLACKRGKDYILSTDIDEETSPYLFRVKTLTEKLSAEDETLFIDTCIMFKTEPTKLANILQSLAASAVPQPPQMMFEGLIGRMNLGDL